VTAAWTLESVRPYAGPRLSLKRRCMYKSEARARIPRAAPERFVCAVRAFRAHAHAAAADAEPQGGPSPLGPPVMQPIKSGSNLINIDRAGFKPHPKMK